MIGFNHLGQRGRLGNQMFQYATLRGIAAHKGYEFCIPPSKFRNEWEDHQLLEAFTLPHLRHRKILRGQYLQERVFCFDKKLFDRCPDNVSLYGWFQTEKYFKHVEEEIREDFEFKNKIRRVCDKFLAHTDRTKIALHVRRGDYESMPENHPPCTVKYYAKALEMFGRDIQVLIFSDDPTWCRRQKLFSSDRFVVSRFTNNVEDLYVMSQCSHFIIANSSFSWWGAWLSSNKNKRVIAPRRWFGSGYTSVHDTKDLLPKKWETI